MKKILLCAAPALMLFSCGHPQGGLALIPAENFDSTINNSPVKLYTLSDGDLTMQVTNFGGRVVSLFTPDKNGDMADIVVGRRSLREYTDPQGERFLGACVGPVANRIGGASFTIDGQTYTVPANDNKVNTLHGGYLGLDNVVWDVVSADASSIVLHYLRPDGQEGYPGNLDITMTYSLGHGCFKVEYSATTDKATPVNISHHSFFNLRGEGVGTVEDYIMTIAASAYTPIDTLSIPLGQNESVEGTPFDFREPHRIGERIDQEGNEQLKNARGYDHNWVLDGPAGSVRSVCTVWDPECGRCIEVLTDQPGMQFYSGNFFSGKGGVAKNGKPIEYRSSLALETQFFPDSPNQPAFPQITLQPGETYTHTCIYRFGVK
jgi:aldose 1-epimerase